MLLNSILMHPFFTLLNIGKNVNTDLLDIQNINIGAKWKCPSKIFLKRKRLWLLLKKYFFHNRHLVLLCNPN